MWNSARGSRSQSAAETGMTKLGVALNRDLLKLITDEAARRGISVQALIRAVIIPDWVRLNLEVSNSGTNDLRNNGSILQQPATVSRHGVLVVQDQIMFSPRLRR